MQKSKPHRPINYWNHIKNHRKFLEGLAKKLNLKKWEDWYNVSFADVSRHNANHLLYLYSNSHISAIMTAFPEHYWQAWKFLHAPPGFWFDSLNHRKFFDELTVKLNIKSHEEWYDVPIREIRKNGGSGVLHFFENNLAKALSNIYPEYPWDSNRFLSRGKFSSQGKTQHRIRLLLIDLYPEVDIHNNYMLETDGGTYELDIFIPSQNLAFEYQGEQHFEDFNFFGVPSVRQNTDEKKYYVCKKLGIKLIHIPFWWEGSKERLIELIKDSESIN